MTDALTVALVVLAGVALALTVTGIRRMRRDRIELAEADAWVAELRGMRGESR